MKIHNTFKRINKINKTPNAKYVIVTFTLVSRYKLTNCILHYVNFQYVSFNFCIDNFLGSSKLIRVLKCMIN